MSNAQKTRNFIASLCNKPYSTVSYSTLARFLKSGSLEWDATNGAAHYFALGYGLIEPVHGKMVKTWTGCAVSGEVK